MALMGPLACTEKIIESLARRLSFLLSSVVGRCTSRFGIMSLDQKLSTSVGFSFVEYLCLNP